MTSSHKDNETEALMANVIKQFGRIVELSPGLPQEIGAMAKSIKEPGTLADMVASTINSSPEEKQKVLEMQDVKTPQGRHQAGQPPAGDPGTGQQDPDPGQGGHGQKPARVLPAPAAQGHQRGAGRNRRSQVEVDEYRAKIEEKNLPEEAVKRKPSGNWTACPHAPLFGRVHGGHPPTWTGSPSCPGTKAPRTTWTSRKPARCWTRTTSAWKNPKNGSSNTWP
jgi:hypothetical protein